MKIIPKFNFKNNKYKTIKKIFIIEKIINLKLILKKIINIRKK